jgi:hypothetical protein
MQLHITTQCLPFERVVHEVLVDGLLERFLLELRPVQLLRLLLVSRGRAVLSHVPEFDATLAVVAKRSSILWREYSKA